MEQLTVKNYNPAMSEDIRAIAQAFLLAKNEFRATGLAGTNAHQKYNYAKIGDIYHAVEGALSKNNIIIWHFARPTDGGIEYLYTRLIHTLTGQFIEDCRILESEKAGNQAKGAANTYMKKYALLSLCAIATEDDDGEDEQKHIDKKPKQSELLVKDEIEYLHAQLKACANGKLLYATILKDNDIRSFTDLPFACYETVKSYIAKNRG
ncbi:MAG TPA: ERF family protein [Candidatus Saccharimonadales bacterium]